MYFFGDKIVVQGCHGPWDARFILWVKNKQGNKFAMVQNEGGPYFVLPDQVEPRNTPDDISLPEFVPIKQVKDWLKSSPIKVSNSQLRRLSIMLWIEHMRMECLLVAKNQVLNQKETINA